MQASAKLVKDFENNDRAALDTMLLGAHSQVEARFLDGGTVLLSIMDVIAKLIGSLDRLTGSLDQETTQGTVGGILKTAERLAALPSREAGRQESFETLSMTAAKMHSHVCDMQETMRYLRTFALTAKITGAGIPDFAGFAEEILERIQSGSSEVNRFASQLSTLDAQLRRARGFAATIATEYSKTVPQIVTDLRENAAKVGTHHQKLGKIAQDVSRLARGVQSKIATVLSALQIGDITRQRIEHVQASFRLYEELVASDATLNADAKARMMNVVYHLAAAQLAEMVEDFQRESRNVVRNMSGFVDDTRRIMQLRDAMTQGGDGDGQNFLRTLEGSVEAGAALVGRVKAASGEADQVAASTTGTAKDLLAAITVIRAIKSDINYMALNTNLRCSRLGEEARSINVVTAELRLFAAKLEESAETVVQQLTILDDAAKGLSANGATGADTIDQPLADALQMIRDAGATMDTHLAELAAEGEQMFNQVGRSIKTLDFESELGDVLERCAAELAHLAGPDIADISDLAAKAEELGQRIHKTYTMAQERSVHQHFLPATAASAPAVETAPAASSGDDEEDLFAAARL